MLKQQGSAWYFFINSVVLFFGISSFVQPVYGAESGTSGLEIITGGGCVLDTVTMGHPLLLVHDTDQTVWNFINSFENLPDEATALTEGISCTKTTCILVGKYAAYNPHSNIYFPLVATSTDRGKSWLPTPIYGWPLVKKGQVSSIECTDHRCVAIAHSDNDNYILKSDDNGNSWVFNPINLNNLSPVYCKNELCVIAGRNDKMPISFLISKNSGETWQSQESIVGAPLHAQYDITSISHSENSIIAVGNYHLKSALPSDRQHFFILKSEDAGRSWRFIANINKYSDQIMRSRLYSVSCNGKKCSAVGDYSYEKKDDSYSESWRHWHPLIFSSQDYGKTWTFINTISERATDKYFGALKDLDCRGSDYCNAVGWRILSENKMAPLVLRDEGEKGSVWFKNTSYTMPPDSRLGRFTQIRCSNTICVIRGIYMGFDDWQIPILISKTKGEKWLYQDNDLLDLRIYFAKDYRGDEMGSSIYVG